MHVEHRDPSLHSNALLKKFGYECRTIRPFEGFSRNFFNDIVIINSYHITMKMFTFLFKQINDQTHKSFKSFVMRFLGIKQD